MSSQNNSTTNRGNQVDVGRQPWSLHSELVVSILLLLTVIVSGFGGSIYWLMRQSMYRQAESDLLGAAQLLVQDLKQQAPGQRLSISRAYQHRFGPAPRDHAYFVVWDADGHQLAGTDPLPPHVVPPSTLPPTDGPRPFLTQTHGTHLDVLIRGPLQTAAASGYAVVLIGRPLAREFDQLERMAVTVALFGLTCLLVGGAGVWWLARRIVHPIESFAQTAESITAKNLDQRLELRGASSELARLAHVFNSMLERLRASFQRQIRFTADASHELRTPVTVILAQSEQTLTRPRSPEEYAAALGTCLRSARRMKRLVDDLLLLARADSGRLELRRERLDLAEVARQAVSLLEPLARERQIPLTAQLQTTFIQGDAVRVSQVITNLVSNALHYNRPDGTVFVTVHSRGTTACLTIADTGLGISAEDRPRLFERFYRADTARTHFDSQGTGLGLSIVAEIVTAHEGTIDVTSELGVGTTVTVEFPIDSFANAN